MKRGPFTDGIFLACIAGMLGIIGFAAWFLYRGGAF